MSYPPPAEPASSTGSNYGYPPPSYAPSLTSSEIRSSPHPPSNYKPNVTLSMDPTPGTNQIQLGLDIGYFKTLPGILKLIQLGLGLLCMILASPARAYGLFYTGVAQNHWFLFVVVTAFICTLLWTFFYFLQLRNVIAKTLPFSWLKLEYFYTFVTTILYIIAFIVILEGFGVCPHLNHCNYRIAAGSFAIFNTIAYMAGTYLLHKEYTSQVPT